MPVTLIPTSRRKFLTTTSLGALSLASQANENTPSWFALLADTHIDADPQKSARGAVMAENLKKVVAEILAEPTHPEFAVINGDCAYLRGLESDYATLRPLVTPLLDAGIPVHLTMGNHDDRGPFFGVFPEALPKQPLLKDRHLAVIDSPLVNWFLLDTLQIVNKVTGEIGAEQRKWLSESIDAHGNKPAILIGHHYPQYMPEGSTERVSGLADTIEFMDLLRSKPQIKAYVYGHSHSYGFKEASGGIHLINQPPVAYVFDQAKPNGWIKAVVNKDSMTTTLKALDKSHEKHGESTSLAWK